MEIAGDKDIWARAAARKLRIALIPKILYLYTKHSGQLSKNSAFADRKAGDAARAAEKDYPHAWLKAIQLEVQRIRRGRRIFWIGRGIERKIYEEVG